MKISGYRLIKRFVYKNNKPVKPMSKSQKVYRDRVIQKLKNNEYQLEEVNMCICGNTKFNLFSERERYGLSMKTVICNACGILIQSPRLSSPSSVDFYKNYYRDFYMPDSSPELLFKSQINLGNKVLKYLSQSNIKLPANAKVLDAGCGAGGALQAFSEQDHECTGCDFTDQMTSYGKTQGLNLISGGVEELSQRHSSYFDLVMLNDVLEHLLDPRKFLNDMHKILKADGIVYVQFPGNRGLRDWKYPDVLRLLQLAHTYYFDLKQLEYLFLISGYEMITGNESLQAIFRKGRPESLESRKKILVEELHEYSGKILEYISQCERQRLSLFFKNNLGLLFKNPKSFVGHTLFFLRHSIFN